MDYKQGYKDGQEDYKKHILEQYKAGKPIEIDGRAYYLQSDIEHLKQITKGE